MAENIRVNRKTADAWQAEQQTCASFENELQSSRRQRIQQRKSMDGLFQQHRVATAEFLAFARLPFTRKALFCNHDLLTIN
jgi:hypothetical protein